MPCTGGKWIETDEEAETRTAGKRKKNQRLHGILLTRVRPPRTIRHNQVLATEGPSGPHALWCAKLQRNRRMPQLLSSLL